MMLKKGIAGLMLLVFLFAGSTLIQADYPSQPIELNVVYPEGGGMDVTARNLARYAEGYVGNDLIVVNRTGAGAWSDTPIWLLQPPMMAIPLGFWPIPLFPIFCGGMPPSRSMT